MLCRGLLAVLAAASCRQAFSVNVDVENGVYKLGEEAFDVAVSKQKLLMVSFCIPESKACKELLPSYEKAGKKLKKLEKGPRLGKVDATTDLALAEKYAVSSFPTLLVFKDGKLHGRYTSGLDKEDIVGYMEAFVDYPEALVPARQAYLLVYHYYKEVLRLIFPGAIRKILFKGFAVVLFMPFTLFFLCRICCSGPTKEAKAPKKKPEPKAAEAKKSEKKEDADKGAEEKKED